MGTCDGVESACVSADKTEACDRLGRPGLRLGCDTGSPATSALGGEISAAVMFEDADACCITGDRRRPRDRLDRFGSSGEAGVEAFSASTMAGAADSWCRGDVTARVRVEGIESRELRRAEWAAGELGKEGIADDDNVVCSKAKLAAGTWSITPSGSDFLGRPRGLLGCGGCCALGESCLRRTGPASSLASSSSLLCSAFWTLEPEDTMRADLRLGVAVRDEDWLDCCCASSEARVGELSG